MDVLNSAVSGATTHDALNVLVNHADEPMGLFYDGLHVTEEGSRRYAEHSAGRLLETVLRRGER